MKLRIALAQINVTVGDLAGNQDRVRACLNEARELGVELVAFPEMVLTGYPPEDLLLKPGFVSDVRRALEDLAPATHGLTAVVGAIWEEGDLYNAAAVFHDGRLVGCECKQHLPNYGVFDENRYFQAGQQCRLFLRGQAAVGISICEDIWYPGGPPTRQALRGGAEVLVNISASPYQLGKSAARERMLATRATDSVAFVAYANLVGGQDELVFDGQSLVCGPQGQVIARARQFEEELLVADLDLKEVLLWRLRDTRRRSLPARDDDGRMLERVNLGELPAKAASNGLRPSLATPLEPVEEVYRALTLSTRDYARKNGFGKVVLGLSGGVDSALVAVIASDALGPENVICVAMPTRYSSGHSLEDARQLTRQLGVRLLEVPIDATFQSFLDTLAPVFTGRPHDLTEENLQPRVRGTVLMALSNKFGWLVLTTGNKSEVAVGYATLYGDTAGGFAVIKDVPKMLVYELCRYRNRVAGGDLIPRRVLEKPPSAELRPDQKDTDSLPHYPVLDPILQAYVEENRDPEDIAGLGFEPHTVRSVTGMVDRNEYKRRQCPPGVKITPRAFGKDWRLPITNRYRPGGSRA